MVHGFGSHVGFSAASTEPASDPFSPSLSLPLPSLGSLSQKEINIYTKLKNWEKQLRNDLGVVSPSGYSIWHTAIFPKHQSSCVTLMVFAIFVPAALLDI